jgi:membrane associated rhomboid family serine protease
VLKGFFFDFGIVPARYFHSGGLSGAGLPLLDYLPFLSSMFLHGGWAHILGNMWFLYLFGDNVEDRMGHVRFLVFYLLSGLSAGAIHYWTNIHSTLPTIGASGAIAGVMGAYFVLYPRSRIITLVPIFFYPLFLEIPAILFLFFWFLTQILSGSLALASGESFGGIAWWAHAGGFAAGIVLQFLFVRSRGHHRFYFETEHAPW